MSDLERFMSDNMGWPPKSWLDDFPPSGETGIKTEQQAKNAHDARILREAAIIYKMRAKPRGFWGDFMLKTLVKLLTGTAESIEQGKSDPDRETA